jgi:hypothetical protein
MDAAATLALRGDAASSRRARHAPCRTSRRCAIRENARLAEFIERSFQLRAELPEVLRAAAGQAMKVANDYWFGERREMPRSLRLPAGRGHTARGSAVEREGVARHLVGPLMPEAGAG